MRKIYLHIFILLLIVSVGSAYAADIPVHVREMAASFFAADKVVASPSGKSQKIIAESNQIESVYVSHDSVSNPVYVLQKEGRGYVVIADNDKESSIVGYADKNLLDTESLPETFSALLRMYEQGMPVQQTGMMQAISAAEPVVAPMLDIAGIHLNQYVHEEAGSCPSGCVATALVQIMAYHKYPQQGVGSHCYTDNKYGEQCADFENTTYNWNQPTDDDFKLLSRQVGVAMEMQYCFDSNGSAPGASNYISNFSQHFAYHIIQIHNPKNEYVYMELNQGRPMYLELWGDPGHALVIDGYDTNGFLHLNFGWGGSYDGYFLMNTNLKLEGLNYGTNMANVAFISPQPFVMQESDSLSMMQINAQLNKWDVNTSMTTWRGVRVVAGRVVELDLTEGYGVHQQIPEEIGQLDQLFSLKITGNMKGYVPASIFAMPQLRTLMINSYTDTLDTPFPSTIGLMTHLEELDLTRCMSGSLPEELGNLKKLKVLKMWANKLTGGIPGSLTDLLQLRNLNLPENQLSGIIPDSISKLKELVTLDLSNNKFTGTIPESIGELTNLRVLNLSRNQLEGSIPQSFRNLSKIMELYLYSNQLAGDLSPVFDSLPELYTLTLQLNKFNSFPDQVGFLPNLTILNLGNNQIERLPESFGKLSELHDLVLSNNKISDLPISFSRLGNLYGLDLSGNRLTTIPFALLNFTKLNRLDLSHNQLTRIPEVLKMLTPSELYLNNNQMSGPIPLELLCRKFAGFSLKGNRFVYQDIPRSDSILNPVQEQQPVPLLADSFGLMPGDTLHLRALAIISRTSPHDLYNWYAYDPADPYSNALLIMTDSVLKLEGTPEMFNKRIYCVITNQNPPEYDFKNGLMLASLNSLMTDTFSMKRWTEQEYLDDLYQTKVLNSELVKGNDITNRFVTLISPWDVRGVQQWQGSLDQQNWFDLSPDMNQVELKNNLESVQDKELVLFPKTTAYYRNVLLESNCHPRYSDTIKVVPYGKVINDTTVNLSGGFKTVDLDSLEITLPMDLLEGEVRMTVIESDQFPAMPDSVIRHSLIYDVHLDQASKFDKPLIIRFKNFDKAGFDPMKLENYRPAYFDEKLQEWVFYDNASIDSKDTTLTFMTDHLTKLAWFELAHAGYTHRFTNERVNVYYNNEAAYMNTISILYDPKAAIAPNPWYDNNIDPENDGTPYMVQDIAYYTKEVIDAFIAKGLQHPSLRFNVYLKTLGSAAGMTDAGTYLAGRGHIYIDPDVATNMKDDIKGKREYLKSVIAHEYMHFTQDYYMTVMLTNYFWMEATAPLADRIVWPEKEDLETPEPEQLLSEALETNLNENSIFDILSKPWYNSMNIPIVSKLAGSGQTADMNLASLFLHYMRSYRPGKKLDPVELLKQTPYFSSWVGYLDDFIKSNLSDGDAEVNIGTEYDRYVRFLYEGSMTGFNVFNQDKNPDADPLKYLRANYKSFVNKYIRFKDDETKINEPVNFSFGNLSSKMVQIYNMNSYQRMLIKYYRKSKPENISVYTGIYNSDKKLMEWTDVSKKDTITVLAGLYDPSKPNLNDYMTYILFVNKNTGDILNTSVADEMECYPLPDLKFFDGLLFAHKGTATGLPIHTIEETTELQILFGGGEGATFGPSIYRVYASDFNSNMSFNQQITDSTLIVNANSEIINQHMVYNFIKGTLNITHSMRLNNGTYEFEEDFSGSFANVLLKSNGHNKWTANRYSFSTNNSTETRACIKNFQYKFKSIRPYVDGEGVPQTEEESQTYVSTAYPWEDIAVYLMFY